MCKMIKAIIFDFGNVVYRTDWGKVGKLFYKKNRFNIIISKTNLEKDKSILKMYKDLNVGKEDFKNFLLKMNPDINSMGKIMKDYKESYLKSHKLNKEILKIINKLRNKKIRLFGFTDIIKEHYEINRKCDIPSPLKR